NKKDGTFKDEILNRLDHISTNSMGSDYADLNNDLYPDLITVDMLSENYARSKENMASMDTQSFLTMVDIGYHHTYMANTLHYNTGQGKFKETSQMSGVTKTDWSWAPLIADFDNDGLKDLFVTNGVDKDYTNQDVRKQLYAIMESGKAMPLEEVLDMIPSEKLNNYIYQNNGDLTFTKKIEAWGLNDPGYSNGAAYADLDNDGDLDLITNNLYDAAGIYKNNANNNYLQVTLAGPANNPLGIGAKVIVKHGDKAQIQEQYLTRGFESSVSKVLQFGLGDHPEITEILVAWPDGKVSKTTNVKANQRLAISYNTAKNESVTFRSKERLKKEVDPGALGISYAHKENDFNDYSLQLLLPQKQSSKGTGIITGDLNNDGLDDFFVGNAAGAPAAMYFQKEDGTFSEANASLWRSEAKYEDANALFFDADTDGDLDLYVVSAGYELSENDPLLQDRLYTNDGKGNFIKTSALPKMLGSGKSIAAGDFDKDGDLDLFVGGNVVSKKYPLAPGSYLLENQKGIFKDITPANQDLEAIGMVSDALFTDYDSDGDLDLMVIGEWMGPTFFDNTNGRFKRSEKTSGLDTSEGWWFSISETDFDGDGDMDYMLGNIGKNNKFQPKKDKPIYIYGKDFDNNGSFDVALSKINDGRLVPVRGKQCSSEQNPFLLEKIQSFKEFASLEMKDIYGEDKLKDAYKLVAHAFESMYAENLGNGAFKLHKLPNEAQLGPTMAFLTKDYNNDGKMDVMGIGAIYDAEVETIRYDSNYGYVLLGDGKGGFSYSEAYDPYIHWDAKDIAEISIQGVQHYMVVSNNAPLKIFTF
ncbi:VCBS repeat-containing protein, partial [Altibacter sp.]|uniref:VCBS repeat-containing protein n=1 Tax=Altibacter sp. TaxID=2024823 RepID=UPI0025894CCA